MRRRWRRRCGLNRGLLSVASLGSGRVRANGRGAGRIGAGSGDGLFFPRRYYALAGELPWFGRRRYRRLAMVFGGEESLVSARRSLMLKLRRNSRDVLLVDRGLLFRGRSNGHSAAAAIEADP
jgi:hypothetical protein